MLPGIGAGNMLVTRARAPPQKGGGIIEIIPIYAAWLFVKDLRRCCSSKQEAGVGGAKRSSYCQRKSYC